MRLRDAGMLKSAIETLADLKGQLENSRSAKVVEAARDAYLSWLETAELQFDSLFRDDMVALLHTPSYWEIRRVHSTTPRAFPLIHSETDRQVRRLDEMIDGLRRHQRFAGSPGLPVIPDTSALVRGEFFTDFQWQKRMVTDGPVRLVVPIIVVEELDKLKDRERTAKAGDRARRVLKKMRELTRAVEPGVPAPVREGVTIEVLIDNDWNQRRPTPDAEIIDQALVVQEMVGTAATLACVDASMEFRARQQGLRVFEMPTPQDVREKSVGE